MKSITIATHSGFFHADELFAISILKIFFQNQKKEIKIVRTRDAELAFQCDYTVDVGRTYDASKNRFDHHQSDSSLVRENGIPHAAFGLVWKHYGLNLVSSERVFDIVEQKLVQPIDAIDNAIALSNKIFDHLSEYNFASAISAISVYHGTDKLDESFNICLKICEEVLLGEIKRAEDIVVAEVEVSKAISAQKEPEILILDKYYTWKKTVVNYPNIKFVLYPDINSSKWFAQPAKNSLEDFGDERISFPDNWLGKENDELVEVSNVADAVFCHKSGYLAVAKSKQGAIDLAQKVLQLN